MNTNTKSWTKKDLKNGYGISYDTLLVWLLKIPGITHLMTEQELKKTRKFTPAVSQMIIEHLGEP